MKLGMVFLPRMLALSWALFWLFFFVAESWVWRTSARVAAFWSGLGLLFLILAILACRSELIGGLMLAGSGLALGVAYAIWPPPELPVLARIITVVTLSGPPVLAGMLFIREAGKRLPASGTPL